jgi:nucleoside-diphosphate-sugar epimerase
MTLSKEILRPSDASGMKRNYSLPKRVLVTGGAGFLGSHLCERLRAEGQDVLCVDNFFTGTKDNIAHLLGNPHFELIRHDVTFPLYLRGEDNLELESENPARRRAEKNHPFLFGAARKQERTLGEGSRNLREIRRV